MSWNNIIPASVINDLLDEIAKEPKQLHFDEGAFYPCYTIKHEYLTSCNEAFTWVSSTGRGPSGTISKSVDHPAFTALRNHLAVKGYIKIQNGWVNGDRVMMPFSLNEKYFAAGDKFPCANAMKWRLRNDS